MPWYEKWIAALADLLVETGLVDVAEMKAGQALDVVTADPALITAQRMAAGLAKRLAKTRKIGAAAKLRIVEAGKRHLKHVSPRKMIQNMTRPQAMAAAGSLLAAVALATGGRDRLASAAKAGMKLAAFRDVLWAPAAKHRKTLKRSKVPVC